MNKRFLTAAVVLMVCISMLKAETGVPAQQSASDRLGMSGDKILSMSADKWSELYVRKNQGGEAGYDQAYAVYAECQKQRNDVALKKLPPAAAQRIKNYRALCGAFREDMLYLQQAYAGGGTIYTHGATRGQVDDEKLIEALIKARQGPATAAYGHAASGVLMKVRRRVQGMNPSVPRNKKRLAEYSTGGQADETYPKVKKDFAGIEALLATERPEMRSLVLKFVETASKEYVSEN